MSQSTYSEEEVAEILHNLIEEKKRSQELEIELERLQKSSSKDSLEPNEQTHKFKQLIGVLRKKYEEAQHRNTEQQKRIEQLLLEHDQQKTLQASFIEEQKQKEHRIQGLIAELKESQENLQEGAQNLKDSEEELQALHEQLVKLKEIIQNTNQGEQQYKTELEGHKQKQVQLERVIQFLRQRSEEAHLENHALSQELQSAQASVKQAQSQLEEAKAKENAFQDTLKAELHEKENLKQQCASLKSALEESKETIVHLQLAIEEHEKDKGSSEKRFLEQKELLFSSKEELEFIKQMMVKTLQEAKEERAKSEERHLNKIKELEEEIAAITKSSTDEGAMLKEKLKLAEKDKELSEKNIKEKLAEEMEEWKRKLGDSAKEIESLKLAFVKKQEEVEHLQNETEHLAKGQADLEEQLNKAESDKDEAESRLKVAQQHLAKKVRETSLLSEKNEEMRLQVLEMQNAIDASKAKIIELQSNLEMETNHQRRLQEQYHEGLKSFEAQTVKWEEKYFLMHEKWQESESRIRDFKKMEERHLKLQQVLNHLGSLLGSPLALPANMHELQPADPFPAEKERLSSEQPYPATFFDIPEPPQQRFRETFFE